MRYQTIQGNYNATSLRVGIVVSRFNQTITQNLLDGAIDALARHNISLENVTVVWVPGAMELPLTAQALADTGRFDAIICLGAVIQGATDHYDYVCQQSASGIARASQECGLPILFGVLTTHTIEQALERAGLKSGNKGFEVAMAAIEMANVMRRIEMLKSSHAPVQRGVVQDSTVPL
ncbi:MAG: 6,7-dimethyl-8-ribityllumazine synthase [Parachlamydiales bacterium]|jgi:6,7-dimethyl-8-ribityllumazine synthase